MTAAGLQLEHHFSQTFVCNFVLDLLSVRLRNLIVLAVHAAQVAVTEEDVAGSARPNQRRLFTVVRCVRRHDRQATRVAGRDFIVEPIVQTVARADGASLQEGLKCFHTTLQFAALRESMIGRAMGFVIRNPHSEIRRFSIMTESLFCWPRSKLPALSLRSKRQAKMKAHPYLNRIYSA